MCIAMPVKLNINLVLLCLYVLKLVQVWIDCALPLLTVSSLGDYFFENDLSDTSRPIGRRSLLGLSLS